MSKIIIIGDGGIVTTPSGGGGTSDVNLVEIAGTAAAVNNGPATAGTLRTATASDSPEVVSVASIDTKTPALGGAATAASVPVNIASDQNVPVQGDTAHGATDAGAPVAIGGNAQSTEPAPVTAGQRVRAVFNLFGELIIAAYNYTTNSLRTSENDPLDQRFENESLVDTTNETAATHHYPSATGAVQDGYSLLSQTIKVIDGDGTVTITLEATNDEDASGGDWHDVTTALGCDASDNPAYRNTTGNLSYIVTNGTLTLALAVKIFPYRRYRWVFIFSGATNTAIAKNRVVWL